MSDIPAITPVAAPAISAGVGVDTSRLQSRANLEAAGKKFEAVFTNMMVKAMHSTHLAEDTLFGSKGMDTFKDMQSTQLAQSMAEHAPLGIGKAMTDFLAKSQKGLQADPPGDQP
ncbi:MULTISPECIES: rod-binding protein [Sphingomonas]|jgi:flagellar protein FlgJ|uniref:rod-binding protein n=1 Tax=Sphingomonas TaxID=13687 RepID=UPI000F8843A1|nr:rod-binding protein [Sphingomonas sp. TF3]RUN77037.1 rod-binding protein [Sphingomonas sp. TF3]